MPALSRRALIAASLAGGAALAQPLRAARAATRSGPLLDLATPEGNALAYARIQGNLDPKATSYSWYAGRVSGHRPGEAGVDLMGIIGMGAVRLLPLEGEYGWMMLRKELGFFTSLETGAVIDRWTNPYTSENVEVVHLANPAINAPIRPYERSQGLYQEVGKPDERTPFLLEWREVGGRVMTERHAHIRAKNPLDPKVWQRESSGEFISISDSNSFNVSLADLQNAALTKVESFGNWTHNRPWQPWMLMGPAEGHIQYTCFTGSAASLETMPSEIVALARARFPDFLTAPTEVKKAESSLARYMRTRTPQPPRP
ncbi:MAG: DUF1838 family protein [Polymorphobacter sp.]|uniref:DUF1838 family protein n=1 Tax=Polymorphobacter sp. TaxID=1909290 RepID=UPI003A8B255B